MRSCIFYILIFFLFQNSAISQDALKVLGEVSDSYGALKRTLIEIKKDTGVIDTYKSNKKGAFYFELNYGFKYLVSFSKNGYSNKSVIINTKLPEKIPAEINQVIRMKLELIEKLSETNQSSEPLGKISFNRITKEFSYESKYNNNSFTNIEVAGVGYYLSERRKLGLPVDEPEQEVKTKFPFNEAYYRKRKLEFFEKIIDKRSELIADNDALYKEQNNEQNLIKEMPLDTTISRYSAFNMDITEVILNNERILRVYHRVKHDWGEIFYFKNYRAISKTLFYLETNLEKKRLKRSTSDHSTLSSSN